MKRIVLTLALALGVAPLVAAAQGAAGGGPPPEMRAKMEQMRGDAKTASYNALSNDHRTRVQAIVDKFDAGTTADPRDAATQIDGILTPDEAKAVLAQRQSMRDAMRAAFTQNGGATSEHRDGGQADAGRFLLGVSADPQKLHAAMRAEREHAQQ